MSKVAEIIQKYNDHKREMILKHGESIQESEVYCPHCAHEQDSTDVWESGLKPNDSDHEYECSSCEETFTINARVMFSTYK